MPESESHSSDNSSSKQRQARRQQAPSVDQMQMASGSDRGTEELQHPWESMLGTDFSQGTFERHAALLGDSRLSQSMYAGQRAMVVQRLQRDYGNRYVQRIVDHIKHQRSESSQIRRAVSEPGDTHEQEADRVANPVAGTTEATSQRLVQRQEDQEELQMNPLPGSARDSRERAFGADLSARAFTPGQDSQFERGEYDITNTTGNGVLAHELIQATQQGPARIRRDDVTSSEISESTDTGNKYTQELVLNKTKASITIHLAVNWVKKGTWTDDDAYNQFIRKVKTSFYGYADNKFKVVCAPTAKEAGPAPVNLPIDFIIYDMDSGYKIEVHGGTPGGGSAMSQTGGDIYEYDPDDNPERPITFAHEFGHAILGVSDEYANPRMPGRVLTNDHSIMANYYTQGIPQAEFKARHFQHIVTEVAKAFAGYTCTIKAI